MIAVTEFDLRAPEFKQHDIKPEDYELRSDGKIVRKDRWEKAIREIATEIDMDLMECEIEDVINKVRRIRATFNELEFDHV